MGTWDGGGLELDPCPGIEGGDLTFPGEVGSVYLLYRSSSEDVGLDDDVELWDWCSSTPQDMSLHWFVNASSLLFSSLADPIDLSSAANGGSLQELPLLHPWVGGALTACTGAMGPGSSQDHCILFFRQGALLNQKPMLGMITGQVTWNGTS